MTKSPDRSRRTSEDRANRYKYGGYVESPAKLERQLEEGLERTRQRLTEQREQIARQARMRRNGDR
jgi:hypothetical protein